MDTNRKGQLFVLIHVVSGSCRPLLHVFCFILILIRTTCFHANACLNVIYLICHKFHYTCESAIHISHYETPVRHNNNFPAPVSRSRTAAVWISSLTMPLTYQYAPVTYLFKSHYTNGFGNLAQNLPVQKSDS